MESRRKMKPEKTEVIVKKFKHCQLAVGERLFYWILWIPISLYPFYQCYKLSNQHHNDVKEQLTTDSLGFLYDDTNTEWSSWRTGALLLGIVSVFHVCVVKLCREIFQPYYQQQMIFVSTLVLHCFMLSVKGLVMVLLISVFFYYISKFTKQILITWALSIATLYVLTNEQLNTKVMTLFGVHSEFSWMTELTLIMSILKIISFSYHMQTKDFELLSCLQYVLYIPVCFNGPIITFDIFYNEFYTQRERKQFTNREIIKDCILTLANVVVFQVFLRLVHVNILADRFDILKTMSPLDASSMFWVHLNIFNIEYFIYYRFSGIFAKVDGTTPPGPPKCIASLYTFVDMWRYFDKGLNVFLWQYIYLPLGGSRHGFVWQTFASLLCFAFVGFWHGGDFTLMFWAISNWFGIVVESIATRFLKTTFYLNWRIRMGEKMHRRLCAAAGSFSVFSLVYTNMVYLVGYEAATILLGRVFTVWYWPLYMLFIIYCANQCSIDMSYT